MGGYVAPPEGRKGGEMRGIDLVNSRVVSPEVPALGLRTAMCEDGKINVSLTGDLESAAAKCPLCRSGVNGWLRVFLS